MRPRWVGGVVRQRGWSEKKMSVKLFITQRNRMVPHKLFVKDLQ